MRLTLSVGESCRYYMDQIFQNLNCRYVECDEIWTYVFKKQSHLKPKEKRGEMGDQYVFVALDRDTKLVPIFMVGKRNIDTATLFMAELKKRISNRFQLTTDKFLVYFEVVDSVFGADIDYAQLRKVYQGNGNGNREGYSPSDLKRIDISKLIGKSDSGKICTSYIERQNLTMRTHIKRLNRLTIAFSKKLDNLRAALALHFWHYNFMRQHRTLRMTPAMAAGITTTFSVWEDVIK